MADREGHSLLGFLRYVRAEHGEDDATDGRLLGRFVASGDDEDAFTTLVGRHGPMVWVYAAVSERLAGRRRCFPGNVSRPGRKAAGSLFRGCLAGSMASLIVPH